MNISTPGIEECKQVITELEKLRTRPKAGAIGDASPGHGLDVVSAANGIPGPVIDATGAPINSTLSASVIEEAEPDPAVGSAATGAREGARVADSAGESDRGTSACAREKAIELNRKTSREALGTVDELPSLK